MSKVREVNGIKFSFVSSAEYFDGIHTRSMVGTSRETGADVVLLLSEGTSQEDLSDEFLISILSSLQSEEQEIED